MVSARQSEQFATYMLQQVAAWNSHRGWVMQFHLGMLRNIPASEAAESRFPANESDVINDGPLISTLNAFLYSLNRSDTLPKTTFFNTNPAQAHAFASLEARFRNGEIAGKLQLGIGSEVLKDLQALNAQLNSLSTYSLLSHSIGLATGLSGFLSFTRHEYFRRVLCNSLGKDMEAGLIPRDFDLVGNLVARISYQNAQDYFAFSRS